MPRIIIIIAGIICVLVGIFLGIAQGIAFVSSITSPYYIFSESNTLSGVSQEAIILLTNIWLILGGITGGLLLLMPVKFGRFIRVAGYTVPDADVIHKAYRASGLYLLVPGIASMTSHIFLVDAEIVLIPLLAIILGIFGLVASFMRR